MNNAPNVPFKVAIIGGGPAGLMAAEVLSMQGIKVDIYDAMPSPGRKFLLAGLGGMNITHSEPLPDFLARYGTASESLRSAIEAFPPNAVRQWMQTLGIDSFIGSSGRVFPVGMKAAPLLRAWLSRLRAHGVSLHVRHRWLGWQEDLPQAALRLSSPSGERLIKPDAVLLALGGGSWGKLGSDGRWLPILAQQGIALQPLKPANCGFDVAGWSEHFSLRHAGTPLKSIALSVQKTNGQWLSRMGELLITQTGVEGSSIYALSSFLREAIEQNGKTTLWIDLLPMHDAAKVWQEVQHPRGARSLSSHLQSRLGLKGVKAALLRECLPAACFSDMPALARGIKALPIELCCPRPLDEAISSAGGVMFSSLDNKLMLKQLPGVFCAGEMIDWEAPTGGYLLTACLATGRSAGEGILHWLHNKSSVRIT